MMRLESCLQSVQILDDPRIAGRDQAIGSMLQHLADEALIPEALVTELHEAIVRRDELGPTGIGESVAIPHAWHPALDGMVIALAVSRRGLEYPSLDRQPVHIILLLLTPADPSIEPAKRAAFETWLNHLREPAFRASLRLASTIEELWKAVRAA
jgi:mannitol/fructose-specific phosphotransferase system IIA component (Ntr-type)